VLLRANSYMSSLCEGLRRIHQLQRQHTSSSAAAAGSGDSDSGIGDLSVVSVEALRLVDVSDSHSVLRRYLLDHTHSTTTTTTTHDASSSRTSRDKHVVLDVTGSAALNDILTQVRYVLSIHQSSCNHCHSMRLLSEIVVVGRRHVRRGQK